MRGGDRCLEGSLVEGRPSQGRMPSLLLVVKREGTRGFCESEVSQIHTQMPACSSYQCFYPHSVAPKIGRPEFAVHLSSGAVEVRTRSVCMCVCVCVCVCVCWCVCAWRCALGPRGRDLSVCLSVSLSLSVSVSLCLCLSLSVLICASMRYRRACSCPLG